MINALFVYLENIFYITFGFKTSSPQGLLILLAFDLIFGALTIYFSFDVQNNRLMARYDVEK